MTIATKNSISNEGNEGNEGNEETSGLPDSLSEAETDFIERMGIQVQADGISRIAGRIWGALIVFDQPVCAKTLAELLNISKGSVSTNTRILESLDILERRSIPGARQEHFAIRDNPYQTLIEGQIKRFEASRKFVASARKVLKGKAVQAKLRNLELFYTEYRKACLGLIKAITKN